MSPIWRDLGKSGEWHHEELYPRIKKQEALDYHTFKQRYRDLERGRSKPEDRVVVRGMSASKNRLDMAHTVKEEYGRFEF